MPVLLGLSPQNLATTGIDAASHPQGVLVSPRGGMAQELWRTYYPHWQLHCSCPAERITRILTEHNLTLALAESCSGGGIASAITDIAGASNIFNGGVVVYTAQAKSLLLDIKENELPPGCVDPILTESMAERIRDRLQASLGLAITGALGPKTPASHIAVGEIYIAIADTEKTVVRKFNFSGDRQTIKKAAIEAALNFLLTFIARWYIA